MKQPTGPHILVFGTMPRGPLAILRETWLGQRPMPDSGTGGDISVYLENLLDRLQTAQAFTSEHAAAEQERHVKHYNLRTRHKQFTVGDKCLILQKDSTASSVFSRWRGPATIVQVCSPYTYMVEYDGGRYHRHVNKLRPFTTRVEDIQTDSVPCDVGDAPVASATNCSVIF